METGIVPSFKETLLDPAISNMGEALTDIAELGLDAVLQDGLLKDIPVFGTIAALCKTGLNLRERNFIRQTASFILSFNQDTISEDKLCAYRQELEKNPKKAEKELGRVILLLDRLLEEKQAKTLGGFYRSYVNDSISWEKFVELSEVNDRMFFGDYAELDSIARKPIKQDEEVSEKRMYIIQRLESLGLVTENRSRLYSGNILTMPETDNRFVTTPLGGTFFSLMDRDGEKTEANDMFPLINNKP